MDTQVCNARRFISSQPTDNIASVRADLSLYPPPTASTFFPWGLLMAHYAIRGLMHEAALKADEDPDRLSFLHSVRVVQRRMARGVAIPPR